MPESPPRRKTLRKAKTVKKQPPGPKLTFKWSVLALKWGTMPDTSATILPPIEIDRPRRQSTVNSRAATGKLIAIVMSLRHWECWLQYAKEKLVIVPKHSSILNELFLSHLDRGSARKSVVSSQESFLLPDLNTRRQSQMSIGQDDLRHGTDILPLIVSYAQVHRVSSPSSDKSRRNSSPSRRNSSPSRGSFSSTRTSPRMRRKVSFASSIGRASERSMSVSSVSKENRVPVNQLEKVEQSDPLQKSIGENDKLYSNTSRKNSLPRLALIEMS